MGQQEIWKDELFESPVVAWKEPKGPWAPHTLSFLSFSANDTEVELCPK